MSSEKHLFFFKGAYRHSILVLSILIIGTLRIIFYGESTTLFIGGGWAVVSLCAVRWYVIDQNAITFRGLFSKIVIPWQEVRQVRNEYPDILLVEKKTFQEEMQLMKKITKDPKQAKKVENFWYLTVTPKHLTKGQLIPPLLQKLAINAAFDQSILRLHG